MCDWFHVLLNNHTDFLILRFDHEVDDLLEFEYFGVAVCIKFECFCPVDDFYFAVSELVEVIEFYFDVVD